MAPRSTAELSVKEKEACVEPVFIGVQGEITAKCSVIDFTSGIYDAAGAQQISVKN
jgi:hypothetical protein